MDPTISVPNLIQPINPITLRRNGNELAMRNVSFSRLWTKDIEEGPWTKKIVVVFWKGRDDVAGIDDDICVDEDRLINVLTMTGDNLVRTISASGDNPTKHLFVYRPITDGHMEVSTETSRSAFDHKHFWRGMFHLFPKGELLVNDHMRQLFAETLADIGREEQQ